MRSRRPPFASHGAAGFSLVELLVVIAIVAVLFALLTSIIIHVREQAQRVKCASNLRQAGVALRAYASANRGRLPAHPYVAKDGYSFAYDVPRATADALVAYTGQYPTLFCPAGEAEYDPRGVEWVWRDKPGGRCITSYHWLFDRATNNVNPLTPPKRLHQTFKAVDPAHAELAVDAVIGWKGRFIEIAPSARGGNLTRTNHVRGAKPTGGNVLFLDGHVIWRPFDQMKVRGGPNELWF